MKAATKADLWANHLATSQIQRYMHKGEKRVAQESGK